MARLLKQNDSSTDLILLGIDLAVSFKECRLWILLDSALFEKIRLTEDVVIDAESAVQASFAAGVHRGAGG